MPRRPATFGERVDAEARAIRGLRQYASKIAAGELSDADIEAMATERVRRDRFSDDGQASPDDVGSWRPLGALVRDAGEPLFEPPWWVADSRAVNAYLDEGDADTPARQYVVSGRRNGRGELSALRIDLDYIPLQGV